MSVEKNSGGAAVLAIGGAAAIAVGLYFLLRKSSANGEPVSNLSGRVTNAFNNLAVSGILVTVAGKSALTDTNGNYSITGLSGTVNVSINASGYVPYTRSIALLEGDNTLNIALTPWATLTGTVTDSVTGAYIPGVTITAQGAFRYVTMTDAVGNYSLVVPFGAYDVSASKTGYVTQTYARNINPPTTLLSFSLVQQFADTGIIQGVVSNAANYNPIAGAQVTITGPGGTFIDMTELGGGYGPIEVPTGTYDIIITAQGFEDFIRQDYEVRVGTINDINAAMTPLTIPGGVISGQVTDSVTHFSLGDAHVILSPSGSGPMLDERYTGSDGYYSFPSLAPGTYDVVVEKTGYATQTKQATVVSGSTTQLDFALVMGQEIGFFMQCIDRWNDYPTAYRWSADINEVIFNYGILLTEEWNKTDVNLDTQISWPATLTVELYDLNWQLIVRKVLPVARMYNGHKYVYYTEGTGSPGELVDGGVY